MNLTLESTELDRKVSLAEAYLIMFEFLESNSEGCWNTELGAVMGELSLLTNTNKEKSPLDPSVLTTFLEASEKVLSLKNPKAEYLNADISFEK